MLVTSIFSFSYYVLKRLAFNPFPKKPWFLSFCHTNVLKILWKRRNARDEDSFSLEQDPYSCKFGSVVWPIVIYMIIIILLNGMYQL